MSPWRNSSVSRLGARSKALREPGRKGVVRPDELHPLAVSGDAGDLGGTIRDQQFPAQLPARDGSLLTDLNADELKSGTVPDARLGTNIPRLDETAKQTFDGPVEVSDTVEATGYRVGGVQVVGGRQAAIANLSVAATSGTLPTANGSVTIADAAAPTNAELLEYCRELEAKIEALLASDRAHGLIAT